MAINWICLLIISVFLKTCSSIDPTQSCSEEVCSESTLDTVRGVDPSRVDNFIESENLNHNMEEDIWNTFFEHSCTCSRAAIYAILVVTIFLIYRVARNSICTSEKSKNISRDYEFKDPVIYGNKLIYPGDMIRPLVRKETVFGIGALAQSFHTHQIFWLRSKLPIEENIMREALTILTRQKPFLQQCIKYRFCRMWFQRMNNMKVIFSVVKTNDAMAEYQKLTDFKQDAWNGPLWEAKLLICPSTDNQPEGRNCQSAIIFSVAHCITDALTNNMLCRETVRIYHMLKNEQPIPSVPMILPPALGDEYPSYNIFQVFTKVLRDVVLPVFRDTCNIPGVCPRNVTHNRVIIHPEIDELTEEETANLFAACKKQKLTINSFVATATAFAFAEVANIFSESKLKHLNVIVNHAIDLRRYIETDKSQMYGCYIATCPTTSYVDFQNNDQFWTEAHNLQIDLKNKLTTKFPLLFSSAFNYVWFLQRVLDRKQYVSQYEASYTHLMTSNMADISDQLPRAQETDCVEIYRMFRSITGYHTYMPVVICFHTYRQRMHFSLDYCTSLITDVAARHFFSSFMSILRTKSQQE